MDFSITAEEDALLIRVAAQLRAGHSPTDDDLADELGDEVRPLLQSLLEKGWLVVDAERSLTLSTVAQAALSSRRDVGERRGMRTPRPRPVIAHERGFSDDAGWLEGTGVAVQADDPCPLLLVRLVVRVG
ncbi:hypothetical protein [Streptomyces lydicus]|uniref:hypothetical protein n=1 Tax=Streptomyces lydicus TaxID=47763 RepID=UPI0037CEB64A